MRCNIALAVIFTVVAFASAEPPSSGCDFVKKGSAGVCRCTSSYCDTIAPVGSLGDKDAAVYRSTKEGERLQRLDNMFADEPAKEAHVYTIDASKKYQTMLGFGGAFTDAAAININKLSKGAQTKLYEAYYGDDGLQYTIGRVPIASCDFSTSIYSYDDVEGDLELKHFSIDMDLPEKIPMIKTALGMSKRDISLFASSWSPPAWMTAENTTVGGHFKDGPSSPTSVAYAKYISKFFDAYKDQGIDFWGLTVANEPVGNPLYTPQWQDLIMSAKEQAEFVREALGPVVKGDHPDIQIMMLDDQRPHIPDWSDTVLGDEKASSYIDGIAIHWYSAMEDLFSNFHYITYAHDHHPDKFLLATEACTGYLPWAQGTKIGDWTRGEMYMKDMIGDVTHWAQGWTDWNIALDLSGGPNWAKNVVDAPILIDTEDGDTFYKNPMFYAMGHFSKFVTPGSVRIDLTTKRGITNKPLPCVAFKTPEGTIVAIFHNDSYFFEKAIALNYPGKGYINVTLPARSFATFVFNA